MVAFIFTAFYRAGGGESGGLLDLNPGLAFWTVLTFLAVLFILKKFAWTPILTALDEREKSIKDSLEAAENAKKDTQKLTEENRGIVAKANEEAQKIINSARDFSEQLKKSESEALKAELEKEKAAAFSEIERKKQESIEAIKDQVAELSIEIAEKLIRKNLDKDAQKELISKSLNEIKSN